MIMDLLSSALLLGSMYAAYETIDRIDLGEIISSKFRTYTDYDLIVGYQRKMGFKIPIVCNMKLCPHLLVCGLSGQGKSKCVEYAMRGKDCVLLNSYSEDFASLVCPRINGNKQILEFLTELLNNPIERKRPLYVICDECLTLVHDKAINRCMLEFLGTGRHQSAFAVNIAQRALKTDLSWKDLHNSRLTFKQVESSAYNAILGCNVEKNLTFRNFVLHSDNVYYGKTFNV